MTGYCAAVSLGKLLIAQTEDGEVGIWYGPPGADPSADNWLSVASGTTATEAFERMAGLARRIA